MELKLNIYDGNEIEKTYTSNDFRLMTGTCEDILKLVNIDSFNGKLDDESAMFEIVKIVIGAFQQFNPMMKQIFDGLTDDEYRRTDIKEVATVVLNVVKYTFKELFNVASKN